MAAAQTVLVTQLTGQAWIRGTDGTLTPIHEGMRIPADALIVTSSGGSVQLQADGQPPLIVGENQELLLTADLLSPPLPQEAAVAAPVPTEIDQIIAAINAGQDPFEQLDPTAATLGGGSEGGSTFVRLARILESTTPLALAYENSAAAAIEVPLFSGAGVALDDGQDDVPPAPVPATPQANPDAGSVLEDAAQPLTGNVLANDTLGTGAQAEHLVALSGDGQGQFGQITLNADGSYSYQLNNGLPAVQALGAGQTATESFTYALVDANGASASGSLTVTIVGTNDAPVLSGQVAIVVPEDQTTPVTGQLTVTDVDAGDTHTWTVANGGQGQYGDFSVDQTGRWTYVPGAGNADVQGLTAGEQLTDTITVTVSDGQGGTATQTVTVTIEGADDGAIITPATPGSDVGSVTEETVLTTSGKLNVADPDAGQAVFVGQDVTTTYGQFTLGTDGSWSYQLNNGNPAVQALGVGQTLTETRTVATADGTTANVVITINGTNDVPTLGNSVAAVTEDVAVTNGLLSTSGAVTISDIDSGDNSFQPAAVFSGAGAALGTLVFNTNGTYSYSVDNSRVQYLKTGESVVETYTVTSVDGSASTSITITINGADDGAVIAPATPGSDVGSVTEDGQLIAGGKLNVTDPDAGQAVFVAQNVATTYGQFTIGTDGTWTYALNNANAAVQALGAGQTLTETRPVVTADGTTANVVITINGTNDVPKLGTGVASVTEDVAVANGQLVTSGSVSIADVDAGQNSFQPAAVFNGTGAALGTLVFNTDGSYSYSVDNSRVQYLKTGESVVETYTVTSVDGSASTSITITINGADDGAVIAPATPGSDVGSVTEDGQLIAGGKLNVADPDAGQAVFVAQNVTTTYGQFTIGTDGTWTYALNNANAAVQALGAGQTLTETRTVATADGTTANVVITINGTNDVPTLGTGVASVTEDVAVANGQLVTSGSVSISDIDAGQNSFQPAAVFNGAGAALGTLVFNTDGSYSYSVDNSRVQYLKNGESVVETYTVTSLDGSASTSITITINGSDDGAVIAPATPGSDVGSVTEDAVLTTSGKLNVTDPDAGQAVFVAQNVATTYGQFTIGTDGTWTYALNNANAAVQALGAGQTLTETRPVVTADGTTANVVITINGTNDVPKLGTGVASVTEDVAVANGQLVTSGSVSISDIDAGQNSFQPAAVFNGTGAALGTLVFNTDGSYSYSVDNSRVQYLKTGESVVETYTVTSVDGSASTSITITINGADDGAVIVPGVPGGDLGSVTEETVLTTSGKLNVTDTDAGQAVFVAQNVATTYGQFTIGTDGTWTYALSNANAAVQALGAGQTLTETRPVVTADGTTANVVITINGTNDVPKLGTGVASVTEDVAVANGQLVTSGSVSISDIDAGQNSFQPAAVFNGAGAALGTLVFNTDSSYSYSVDNSRVQYLKTGESVVETYTVTSVDGSASTSITITINGADDGAVIAPSTPGSDVGSVTEDTVLTTSGKLNVTDPDAGQAVFVAQNVATTYGQFTIGTDGTWTYALNNANAAVQAMGAGQTLTETRTVATADGTTANVVITINGTNDVPTLGTGVASVTEDVAVANGQLVTSGSVSISDIDAGQNSFQPAAVFNGTGAALGTLVFNTDGSYSYAVDNSRVQYLKTGESVVETYTVTSLDGSASTSITITINGVDDGAVIVPGVPNGDLGAVTEDTVLTTSGKLNVTDPDAGQAVFVAQNVATTYGQFSIGTDGTWSYQLNNANAAVQALGAGQTLTETRTVVTADGTTANVVITINGTNDVPKLGTGVASVTEDVAVANGQLVTSGSVSISDIDAGQNSFQPAAVFNGAGAALGTLVFNTDGSYSYSVDNSRVQYLKTGESVVETYTVTSVDGSASTSITITINGADDGAVIAPATPGSDVGSVTEDAVLTTSGKLNVTDPDAGQAVFVAQNVATTYGQFTIGTDGTWTYALNNANAAVQALGAGQTLTETRTVATADGTTANVVITINGTNDVPKLGTGVASVTEDVAVANGQLVTSGSVSISDIDAGQNSFQPAAVFNGAGAALGTLVFNTDGSYSYSVDNSRVQYLKTGESVVETYTVTSVDGSASTSITITINGADDGAVIAPSTPGSDVGSVTEETVLTTSGKLNVTDPDAGQAVFVAQNVTTTYGQFTIGTDGTWTYALNNANAAVQALGAGQTLTETRPVVTADGTTANVVITINGTNDVPKLGTSVASVTEDVAVANGQLVTSGSVSISDIDAGQNSFQPAAVFNGAGAVLGTLVFNTDGSYSYSVDNSRVQYLKTGESVVETYTVTSLDGSASTSITITINGSDDGAVIAPATPGSDVGSVTEDAVLTTSGKLNVTDPDAGQAVFVAQNVATTYGQFTIGTDGTWTYALNNANAAVQALGAGQTLTETRPVVTADGTTANVVITINGTNDVPKLGTGVASMTEDVAVANGQLVTSGSVSISDIDAGQNSFQPAAVFNGAGAALGTLVFNTDGSYSYSVDNSRVQYLKNGESVVETYTVTSLDGSASTSITITINGSDDGAVIAPSIPGSDAGSVTEDTVLTTSGKLNVTDPDAGQAVFVAQNVATTYGQFTIGTDGTWTYALNNANAAVQALGAGQTLTETRPVVTADGTTANVVITINGTNDVPKLGTGVASVTEDVAVANGQLVTSGSVSISDIDAGQNSFQPAAVFNGTGAALGTLVFNTDGSYSYSVDSSRVQYLKTGESVVETYTVTSVDGSASTSITITINGVDDGAVIVPGVPNGDLGAVTEDTVLTTSGKLNVTDPDAGQAVFVAQNVATTYGQFTIGTDGTWTYALNNANAAVQALGAGQTLTETRPVVSADGTTANVVITINGTNDVPTLGTGVASVTEDVAVANGQLVTSGSVSISDIDAGQNSFQPAAVFNGAGAALGTLVFNTDGSYSYSVDNSRVQYLKTGESVVETYTVTSLDGSASTSITITINGADDGAVIAPSIPGSDVGSVTEETVLTTSGKLNVTDPDAGQAVFVAQNVTTTYGQFTIGTDGTWTYALNNANAAVQALGAGQTLTETRPVVTADGTTANVVITINGTNDVPKLGTSVASVTEDVAVANGQLVTSGSVSISDIDAGQNSFQPAAVFNGAGAVLGTLVFNTDGSYSYSVDNSRVQYLKTGESVVETYTVTSLDGSASTSITITINGADDGAVIAPSTPGSDVGSVTEETVLTTSGKLNVTDPDAGQAVFVAQNVATTYGQFTIGTDGTWTYALNNANAAVQALGAGQTLTETRPVVTADGTTANVVITINGTNDVPKLGTGVASVTEDVAVANGQLVTSGSVSISDIDAGQNSFQPAAVFNGAGAALGTLVFNTDGSYSYSVNNSRVQYLKTGESVVEAYTVTSVDGSASTSITITINGADDGAVIAPSTPGSDVGSVTEETVLTTSGKLNVTDPDAGQAVFVAQNVATTYGQFSIGTDGTWSYQLNNANAAVQALGAGQTLTETRTVATADGTTANVVITINGTNDVPTLGTGVASVTEDVAVANGQLVTSGSVSISDIDAGQNSFQPAAVFNGTGAALGTLVFNTDGSYSYAVDNSRVQYLKTGESVVETYTVTSLDGSASTSITITINGVDDGAVIVPGVPNGDLGAVTEDTVLTTSGKLNVTDPDAGQAVFVAQNVATTYGQFTIGTDGTWTYALNNANAAVQALGAGQTLTETRPVVTADGTTANVVITINGTNDVPKLGTGVASVTEDVAVANGQLVTSGSVSISDIDAGQNSFQPAAVFNGTGAALGTLVFNTDGSYSYSVDNSRVQYLKTGESVVETYTVTSVDGSASTTITITINGADDGAVIAPATPGSDVGSVTEDGQLIAGGKLNVADPDAGQAVFVAQNVATTYGQFTIGTDGTWTYALNNANAAVQALGAGQTLTETRPVVTADGTTTNVVITINGTNDVPTLGTGVASVAEDVAVANGQLVTSGSVSISDIDAGQNSFQPAAVFNGTGAALGTLVFNTDGSYSYSVDNSRVQYLKTGESVVETYTVTSVDGSASTSITITINGVDDGAVIVPGVPNGDLGAVTEDTVLTTSGKLNVTDPDAGQAVFVAQNVATTYGQFTIGTDGTWTYALNNANAAVQALGAGQTLTETRPVVSADGTTANVVITINGTNDVPTLGTGVASVTEDVAVANGQLVTSGSVSISDIDAGQNSFQPAAVFNGAGAALGTLVFNTDGSYSYSVDNSRVQYLKTGESVVETYTVTSLDGSASTSITITINGADDGAVIAPSIPGSDVGSVTEETVLTTSGKLNVTDPDAGQAVFVAQNVTTTYGQFTIGTDGTWTYALNNANAAVQALGAGQTLTETRPVVTADGTTANVVITINGTNDVPKLGTSVASVTEDVAVANGQLVTSGSVSISDIDAGQNSFQPAAVFNGAGAVLGTLVFNTDGSYSYSVDNSRVQYLKTGESVVETYTVTSLDGSASTSITITINGADDGAVIAPSTPGSDVGSVTEETVLTTSGKLNVTDPDAGQAVFVAQNVATTYGQFTIGTDGTWTYALNNANAAVQALGAGQTLTETRPVVTADGTTANVVITINGTNDVPKLGTGVASVTEDVAVANGQLVTSGSVSISDIDAGQNSFQPAAVFNGAGAALGTLVFNTDGSYSYSVDNSLVQYLKTGESVVETYTVTSVDGSASTSITITINGADDGAVIAPATPGSDVGSVTEDTALTTSGKLNVTDPDAGQAVFVAQNVTTTYGQFTIGTDGTWTYALNNASAAVQALGAGQTLTETRTVATADGTTANVVITINGTNDIPLLSGVLTGTVTEDGIQTANGQLSTTDVDATDTHSYTVIGTAAGAYGSFSVDASTGEWTYQLDNATAQALKTGDTRTETYQVQVSDGNGGTDTKSVTVTINGADDGAVVTPATPGSDAGSVMEDTVLTTSGKLNVTDPDAGQAVFVAQNVATTYGQFTIGTDGTWTYALNNANTAVQALGAGQTLTETRTVATADGTTASVVITINGTNDIPVLSGVLTGTVTEDGVQTANGQLSTRDIDTSDTHSYTVIGTAAGTYGSFSVDASTGEWTYQLDNAAAQALKTGDTRTETYQVQVSDGNGGTDTKSVTVTINGADDGAVVTPAIPGSDRGTVTEDGILTTGGKLNVVDPDAGQPVFVAQSNVSTTYGTFGIDANGNWTYSLNNGNAAVQALGAGQTLTETRQVATADGTTASVVITINGTNDIPRLGSSTRSVTEDAGVVEGKLSTSGMVTIADIDVGQDSFQNGAVFTSSTASNGAQLGTLVFDTNGTYSYTVDNSRVQYLKAGDSVVETYTVTSMDGSASTTITITINGTDDGAVVTGNDTAVLKEDTTTDASGKLNVTDADAGQSSFIEQRDVPVQYGKFTITSDGNWNYRLNNDDPVVQRLGESQILTETVTVRTADGTLAQISVTITGTNDKPQLSQADRSITENPDAAGGVLTAVGSLIISDADAGEASFQPGAVLSKVEGAVLKANTALGTLTFATDGSYRYSVDNGKVAYLKNGESVVETYTVTSYDQTTTSTIVIRIHGADSGAVVTPGKPGDDRGSVTEDGQLTAGGKLNVVDPDAGQAVFVVQNDVTTTYGKFSISSTGTWSYQLNNDNAAVQALGAGHTLSETRQVTTADGTMASVVITINGTNDIPVLSGVLTGTVTEDGVQTANGQLATRDVDSTDRHTYAVLGAAAGTYGSFSVNRTTGEWTYQLNNAAAQALKTGDTRTETYQVQVSDGNGGTDTRSVTVNIQGADDRAVVTPATPGSDRGTVTEDGTLTTSGKLNVTDPDAGQAVFVAQSNVSTTYGTFGIDANGNWTYSLNNGNAAVQALGAGQSLTETRQVTTADGTKASVVITINGTNDVPQLSTGTASVTEDVAVNNSGKLTTLGSVAISDADTGESSFNAGATFTRSTAIDGKQLGVLVFNADGSYSYSVDNSRVQYLKTGQSVVETYTVTSKDNSATTTITITINGANETPVVQAVTATTPEDTLVAVALRGTDADGNIVSFQISSLPDARYGLLYKDAAGKVLLTTQEAISATSNGATVYFKPTPDWSGTTTFKYVAKDNDGMVSTSAGTGTVTVTPVADTPVVNLTVGAGSNPVTTVINTSTVTTTNTGHTVTATNADGSKGTVTVVTGTNHDGFGVSGNVASNGGAASTEVAGNGTVSESLTVAFKVPVTKITVQFAWLAATEQARYRMYDEGGKLIKTDIIQGKTDTVEEQFTLTTPVGTTIGKIVFDAPRNGDDYLVHKVTYTTATTYPLTITADPRDLDYSESITRVVVEVPVGVTLSAGTQIDATHWSLPMASTGGYSVSVDAATKAVTITGLNMTVPENVTVGELKVVATAADGSSTADASYTYRDVPEAKDDTATASLTSRTVNVAAKQETLAAFSANEGTSWRFGGSTTEDKDGANLATNAVLKSDQGKWLSTSLEGTTLDAQVSASALVLRDNNGTGSGDAQLVTPVYSPSVSGTTLQFKVTSLAGFASWGDTASWQLFRSTDGGNNWSAQAGQSGSISSTGPVVTGALDADASYRIVLTVNDNTTSWLSGTASVSFDDFQANVPATTAIAWSSVALNGSVSDNDSWGTLGNTSALAVNVNGAWINAAAGGTTVAGDYGTLVLKSDGSYTYTPTASAAGAGKVDHFEYRLTQADGDTDTANLDITINATGPGASSVSASSRMALPSTAQSDGVHEVHGTAGNDTLVGTAEDDLFVWHQADAGTAARPATDVVKNFGTAGNDALDLSDLLQGEEGATDLSKFLHLETRTDGNGTAIDTVLKVSTGGTLDAHGNGFNQQILVEGVDLTGTSHDQNSMIKELIDQGKLKIDQN